MVLCLLLQMLLTKLATMITIMINERMMIRIRIMIMVMQTGVFFAQANGLPSRVQVATDQPTSGALNLYVCMCL